MFFLLQKGGSEDNVLAETFFLIDQQKFFLAFIELLKGVTKPGAEEMVFFLLQGESALLPKKKHHFPTWRPSPPWECSVI